MLGLVLGFAEHCFSRVWVCSGLGLSIKYIFSITTSSVVGNIVLFFEMVSTVTNSISDCLRKEKLPRVFLNCFLVNRIGAEIDTQATLDTDVYNPDYNVRLEYRDPVTPATSTLMLKVSHPRIEFNQSIEYKLQGNFQKPQSYRLKKLFLRWLQFLSF